MIPSGVGSVVVFLLLIAPGLLFDWLADRRRPTVKESAFREVGRTILASLGFGAVAALVLQVAAAIWSSTLIGPIEFASTDPTLLAAANQGAVVLSLALQTLVACGLVGAYHLVLNRRSSSSLEAVSLWFKAVRAPRPEGLVPYAQIRLTSGSTWSGAVEAYSADLDVTRRELMLSKPIMAARKSEKLAPLSPKWERVVIRGDSIEWIAFKYDAPPTADESQTG